MASAASSSSAASTSFRYRRAAPNDDENVGDSCVNGGHHHDNKNGNNSLKSSTSNGTATSHRPRRPKRIQPQTRRLQKVGFFFRPSCSEEEMTFILIVIMVILAAVLICILYQIVTSIMSSSGGHDIIMRSRGRFFQHDSHHNNMNTKGPDDFEDMPFHSLYRIPEAHNKVGDRSYEYARLRKEVDALLPIDPERSLQAVMRLQQTENLGANDIGTHVMDPSSIYHQDAQGAEIVAEPYDIHNCPFDPPPGYPFQWNLVYELLKDWPVNDYGRVPDRIYQGLCIFDYTRDFEKAMRYRHAELPFVVINDPAVARTAERWAHDGAAGDDYMERMLGKHTKHRAEYNTNNHFLYAVPKAPIRKRGQQHQPKELQDLHGRPAKLQNMESSPDAIRMTYGEWLEKANATKTSFVGPNQEHWYFRLVGCGYLGPDGSCDNGSSEYLFDELPFFQPVDDKIYMGEGSRQKGIHCRFGMQGVIAENHFDGSRNAIVVLRGMRRYILSHPNQCDKLTLLPQGHGSARHSAVDYTNPDLELYPEFAQAMANEVILQAGQVLYLPTNWFHFIVSLNLNMQCNTRSGMTDHYKEPLEECGF